MPSSFLKADANGTIARAGEGCGFALLPGRRRGDTTTRPGSYPVTVKTRDGKQYEVTGPHAFYFSELGQARRSWFSIESGADGANESWNVITFDDPSEGIRIGGRTQITTRVQSATAGPTIVPVNGVGFAVRPGTKSWSAYGGGVLGLARIWVRDLDGVWTDTLEDIDFSVTPTATRLVDATGRVYLRAAAATLTLAIDVMEEVG